MARKTCYYANFLRSNFLQYGRMLVSRAFNKNLNCYIKRTLLRQITTKIVELD